MVFFIQMVTFENVWTWLNTTFVDGVYSEDSDGFMEGGAAFRVGAPRLRQIRSEETGN